MSLIGTLIGAFVTLMPRVKPDERDKRDLEIDKLKRQLETARLECESLTRELANERGLREHWMQEAARIARDNRLLRENAWTRYADAQLQQHALAQAAQANQQNQQELMQWAQGYQDVCNCVPSRSQVWAAKNGLVQEVNALVGQLNRTL